MLYAEDGAHNIGAGITLSSQVQGPFCEAREDLDEVLQKAHLDRDRVQSAKHPAGRRTRSQSLVPYRPRRALGRSFRQPRSRAESRVLTISSRVGSRPAGPTAEQCQNWRDARRAGFLTQAGRSKCSPPGCASYSCSRIPNNPGRRELARSERLLSSVTNSTHVYTPTNLYQESQHT